MPFAIPWWVLPVAKGIGILAAVFFAYQAIDNNWATDAGIAEGRKLAMAEVEPQLAACRLQELAVSDLVKEGEERKARAKEGIRKAQEASRSAQAEAARLRGLAQGQNKTSACPAADAVGEIRRGLQ